MTLSIICLAFAIYLITKKNPKRQEKELLRLSETKFTAVMGGILIVVGFSLPLMKMIEPARGGSDMNSYLIAALLSLLCGVSGSGILLFSMLKKIIACEDKLVVVSLFGKTFSMPWKDITEIKLKPLSSKATFISKQKSVVVGGDPKTYKKFIAIAKTKIPARVSHDLLDKLNNRFL
jgi:UDP-N-acetylmuramyl pentapeptide phosphotransferase/UDP-N-acetylglucosamine-1-phosphate transferase